MHVVAWIVELRVVMVNIHPYSQACISRPMAKKWSQIMWRIQNSRIQWEYWTCNWNIWCLLLGKGRQGGWGVRNFWFLPLETMKQVTRHLTKVKAIISPWWGYPSHYYLTLMRITISLLSHLKWMVLDRVVCKCVFFSFSAPWIFVFPQHIYLSHIRLGEVQVACI